MILYDIENLNPFELTQEYISHECRTMDKEDVYKWVYEDEKQIENYKKEIERLNNIINTFEEDLEREVNISEQDSMVGNYRYTVIHSTLEKMLKYFRELKESVK